MDRQETQLSRRILAMKIAITCIALVAAFLIGAALIALAGVNPWMALRYLVTGSLGSMHSIGDTLTRFVPLLMSTLAFAVGHQVGFMNIGAEGQLAMGSLGAVIVGVYVAALPAFLHVPLALLASFLFGAVWLGIAGFLKIRFKASELLNTMMLNYIAVYIIDILVEGILKEPGSRIDQTQRVLETARLPHILSGTRLHLGFILVLVISWLLYFFLWKTPVGFQIRAVGSSERSARFAGMNVRRMLIIGILISGGIAGIGGGMELLGNQQRLLAGFDLGYGFDGIGAAVMGQYHPLGMILSSLLFAMLRVGAGAMQRNVGVPYPLVYIMQGVVIVTVILSSYFIEKQTEKMTKGAQ